MNDDLVFQPAGSLANAVRNGEVSSTELVETVLLRIEALNPDLNAVVSIDGEGAIVSAQAADKALRLGCEVGPLHGVPITLKDGHDVADMRTTLGTEVLDRIPSTDGTVAARLRAAGAIIIGHTNVPPFLGDYATDNAIFGRTSNPWKLDLSAGGSSGGAAAALAAGLSAADVGSDLAGSLRIPTHFCGVYGLKSTEHRIPLTGFFRPPDGAAQSVRILVSLGPMARDLDDLELLLRLLSGPDRADTDVPPVPLPPRRRREITDLRLAFAPALPDTPVAEELRASVQCIADATGDEGARVDERLPDIDWADQSVFGELMALTEVYAPGAEPRDLAWYFRALDCRDRWMNAWDQFFDDYDALILPPATSVAFRHGESARDQQGLSCVFANLAGLPALTVPNGQDSAGLPTGIQIVGPRWSEIELVEIASCLERAGILPGFRRPPLRSVRE